MKIRFFSIILPAILSFVLVPVFSQEKTKTETSKLTPDSVKEIKFRIIPEKRAVEIEWVQPDEDGEVIIGRSNEPIDTAEKFYFADSLGRFPFSKSKPMNIYLDVNLKPGRYYYAVGAVKRIRKRDIQMFPDVNYTAVPAVVAGDSMQKVEIPAEENSDKFVRNLTAFPYDQYVRLTWDAPKNAEAGKIMYHIYRSDEPMSSVEELRRARKIIELYHPETTYVDKTAGLYKEHYYGVAVSSGDEEFVPLIYKESFVKIGNEKLIENSADSRKEIKSDTKTAENKSDRNNSEDIPAKTETVQKTEEKPSVPSVIPPAAVHTEEPYFLVKDLSFELKADSYIFTWSPAPGAVPNLTIYTVYISSVSPRNLSSALERGKAVKLGEVIHPETVFNVPRNTRNRLMYYAVTAKHLNGKEEFRLEENESFVKIYPGDETNRNKEEAKNKTEDNIIKKDTSEEKKKSKKEVKIYPKEIKDEPLKTFTEEDFDAVMAKYYIKGDYRTAQLKFREISEKGKGKKLRMKSLFYTGLCLFYRGEYEGALIIFQGPELKNYYDKERVDFYTNRCLEKRGKL